MPLIISRGIVARLYASPVFKYAGHIFNWHIMDAEEMGSLKSTVTINAGQFQDLSIHTSVPLPHVGCVSLKMHGREKN